jgi:hypothetical protein
VAGISPSFLQMSTTTGISNDLAPWARPSFRRYSSGSSTAITSRTYGQRGTDWKLELPSQKAGTFQMTDLLRLVGDVSPIDGITTV